MERQASATPHDYADDDIELNSKDFFADMVGLLAENLEETIGLEDSASFISAVGSQLGERISDAYPKVDETEALDEDEVRQKEVAADIGNVCVDLKARIGGNFSVETVERDRVTLTNSRCPFGRRVRGRPSLCMMTANVFGKVAADRNGYAAVHIEKAIAAGDEGCRVIIDLERRDGSSGHEFFD